MKEWMLSLVVILLAAASVRAENPVGTREKKSDDVPVVQTVYVPVFRSEGIDRRTAMLFTELLQKKIETYTCFKVVGSPDGADFIVDATLIPRVKPQAPAH